MNLHREWCRAVSVALALGGAFALWLHFMRMAHDGVGFAPHGLIPAAMMLLPAGLPAPAGKRWAVVAGLIGLILVLSGAIAIAYALDGRFGVATLVLATPAMLIAGWPFAKPYILREER